MIKSSGQVITFYSYKGGTGRTMAVANVACLLASQRVGTKKVLMVDWDLEAPGLPGYFEPYLEKETFADHPGLLDLFILLARALHLLSKKGQESPVTEKKVNEVFDKIDLGDYIVKTHIPGLHLLKAGRSTRDYFNRVNKFEWEKLFYLSPSLWRVLADRLASKYSYVLIDSRTGRTDIGSICTMLMPQKLVIVFTPNRQSLIGVLELIKKAIKIRRESDDLRPLIIFPLASRIDLSQKTLQEVWRYGNNEGIEGFQSLFENLFESIYGLEGYSLQAYFDEVQIPQVSDYAYGEEIAVLREGGGTNGGLRRNYERFAKWLVDINIPFIYGIHTSEERANALSSYHDQGSDFDPKIVETAALAAATQLVTPELLKATQSLTAIYSKLWKKSDKPKIFISHSSGDENEKNIFRWYLAVLQDLNMIGEMWDKSEIRVGQEWRQAIRQSIEISQVAIVLISDSYLRSNYLVGSELPDLLEYKNRKGLVVFPIIAKPCEWYKVDLLDELQVIPRRSTAIWNNPDTSTHEELIKVIVELARILGATDDKIRELLIRLIDFQGNPGNVTDVTQERNNLVISGNLSVKGDAILSDNIVVKGNVHIEGNATFGANNSLKEKI